ncbi:TlpA family protein disulfide reductase [Mucilaginibacter sp. OK283]|jgi:thiol-disulfide isomerase/thioredoxin|uniref:TlpA family protein disulfide reductase n=1 Tax=Mucilaginibacter sp. OK283 TaxID=1881049 RepID=UPI0008B7700A|nr:TlpA family protein disulfide reductase [Mucilaginibacter sp. OK283]SEO79445.1 Thiol-disulfide isomerase or thioredoxin [Mucilaginibacter sp. OK283]
MKLKFRFTGWLLPFRKHHYTFNSYLNPNNDKQPWLNKWSLGLLLLWFVLWLVVSCSNAHAQTIKNVSIGRKVPDVVIKDLINYPQKIVKLSDLKGKVVILDFWATWCTGCLIGMPEIANLKKIYGDRVQFMSVTGQSCEEIQQFLKRNTQVRNLGLTMVVGDKQLKQMFPYRSIPHLVWINKDGIYVGATEKADLNKINIQSMLTSGTGAFKYPKSDNMQFDTQKQLFVNDNGGAPQYFYRSLIAAKKMGLPNSCGQSITKENNYRIFGANEDLASFYGMALAVPGVDLPGNRMIFSDTSFRRKFKFNINFPDNEFAYCYELISADTSATHAHQMMLKELNNWFGLKVWIEKQTVNCWVLSVVTGKLNLRSDSLYAENNLRIKDGQPKFINAGYIEMLTEMMNNDLPIPPLLNETGYHEKVDLSLCRDLTDLHELNASLFKYGLVIKQEKRDLDMMIITPESQYAQITNAE